MGGLSFMAHTRSCSSSLHDQAYSSLRTNVHFHTGVPIWSVQPGGGAARSIAMTKEDV